MTEDVEFEDPTMKLVGIDEFTNMLGAMRRQMSVDVGAIRGEHHGPHEIVMDWTLTFGAEAATVV